MIPSLPLKLYKWSRVTLNYMATIPKTKTTNKVLFDTIREVKKLSVKSKSKLWKAVARELASNASQRAQVNVSKIEKHANSGETVLIAGKILGDGILTKKVTVVSLKASESAIAKITKAGGKYYTIKDYASKSPKDKVKILG